MPKPKKRNLFINSVPKKHFGRSPVHELVTASREYPATARLDLQAAVTGVLVGPLQPKRLLGAHAVQEYQTMTFSQLLVESDYAVTVAPLQYDEIDVGGTMPARCLRNALWLGSDANLAFALLLSRAHRFGREAGLHLEFAVPPGERGLELSRRLLDQIERKVTQVRSYRGKVLSLELSDNYSGAVQGIRVHRLKTVRRDEVILPEKTLSSLERNVTRFIEQAGQAPRDEFGN